MDAGLPSAVRILPGANIVVSSVEIVMIRCWVLTGRCALRSFWYVFPMHVYNIAEPIRFANSMNNVLCLPRHIAR